MAVTIDGSAGVTTNTGAVYNGIQSATAQASTSGTSIDFTSIPSWVKRITVMLNSVSTNGTAGFRVQIGPTIVPETSGYVGSQFESSSLATNNFTAGFDTASVSAAQSYSGAFTLTLLSGNIWCLTAVIGGDAASTSRIISGRKTLAGVLGVVRFTTTNGTDTFDAGSINILYE